MKLTLTLGILSAGNILLTFVTHWYVITRLGVGMETDALFAGMVLPQLVLAVVSGSLTHVLVPLLATEDEGSFRRDAWAFFSGITLLFGVLAFILGASAGYWVPWLVPGFTGEGKALTTALTRVQLLSMVFTASVSVLWSVYHARQKFIWAELSPLLSNLAGFFFLVWALPRYGVTAAAWSLVLRSGLQVALLLPGIGMPESMSLNTPVMREAWRRIRPLLAGTAYYKTDLVVDRALSSLAPAGGLSLFYLGSQIYGAGNQILNKAIAAPAVPILASSAKMGEWGKFRHIYRKRLAAVSVLTVAGYLVFIFFGEAVLRLLIGHGGVTAGNVYLLWLIMVCLGGVFVGGAMGQITSVSFYAKGDTRTPTRLGIWTYTAYVPLKVAFFFYWGLAGLAVSTSLFFVINFVMQFYLLEGIQPPKRRTLYEYK